MTAWRQGEEAVNSDRGHHARVRGAEIGWAAVGRDGAGVTSGYRASGWARTCRAVVCRSRTLQVSLLVYKCSFGIEMSMF